MAAPGGSRNSYLSCAFPDDVRLALASLCSTLTGACAAAGAHFDPMAREDLHCTFFFAGEQLHGLSPGKLSAWHDACRGAAASVASRASPPSLRFARLDLFPPGKSNLVVAVFEATSDLLQLQADIEALGAATGIAINPSLRRLAAAGEPSFPGVTAWVPHCTLGKIRAPKASVAQVGAAVLSSALSFSDPAAAAPAYHHFSVRGLELKGAAPRQQWLEWDLPIGDWGDKATSPPAHASPSAANPGGSGGKGPNSGAGKSYSDKGSGKFGKRGSMRVPSDVVGRLIGRRGEAAKALRERTGCNIRFHSLEPGAADLHQTVTVHGPSEAVVTAALAEVAAIVAGRPVDTSAKPRLAPDVAMPLTRPATAACGFFRRGACRNGAACKWLHSADGGDGLGGQPPAAAFASLSLSGSSADDTGAPPPSPAPASPHSHARSPGCRDSGAGEVAARLFTSFGAFLGAFGKNQNPLVKVHRVGCDCSKAKKVQCALVAAAAASGAAAAAAEKGGGGGGGGGGGDGGVGSGVGSCGDGVGSGTVGSGAGLVAIPDSKTRNAAGFGFVCAGASEALWATDPLACEKALAESIFPRAQAQAQAHAQAQDGKDGARPLPAFPAGFKLSCAACVLETTPNASVFITGPPEAVQRVVDTARAAADAAVAAAAANDAVAATAADDAVAATAADAAVATAAADDAVAADAAADPAFSPTKAAFLPLPPRTPQRQSPCLSPGQSPGLHHDHAHALAAIPVAVLQALSQASSPSKARHGKARNRSPRSPPSGGSAGGGPASGAAAAGSEGAGSAAGSAVEAAVEALHTALEACGLPRKPHAPLVQHHLAAATRNGFFAGDNGGGSRRHRTGGVFAPVVVVLAYDDGLGGGPGAGSLDRWALDLPGGKRHLGETAWGCARRETREETSIDVGPNGVECGGEGDTGGGLVFAPAERVLFESMSYFLLTPAA